MQRAPPLTECHTRNVFHLTHPRTWSQPIGESLTSHQVQHSQKIFQSLHLYANTKCILKQDHEWKSSARSQPSQVEPFLVVDQDVVIFPFFLIVCLYSPSKSKEQRDTLEYKSCYKLWIKRLAALQKTSSGSKSVPGSWPPAPAPQRKTRAPHDCSCCHWLERQKENVC